MGDLRVGDEVFGADGKAIKIKGVYPQGEMDAYEVKLKDGRSTICNDQHLWTYYYSWGNQLVTSALQDMIAVGIKNKKNQGARYRIPSSSAVHFDYTQLDIDPYVIGAFLGDGCCLERQLTLSSIDEDLVAEVSRLIGAKEYVRNTDLNFSWTFIMSDLQKS